MYIFLSLFKIDSEEEDDCSPITTRSTLSMHATKGSDDDCVEVDGPQIRTDMSSNGTTRAATRFRVMGSNEYPSTSSHDGDGKPGTSTGHEDSYGFNHTVSSSGHDGGCLARGDGNPGTSGTTTDHGGDYASYLTLVATLPPDSSDDEELNLAIIAGMESQM